MGNRVDYEGCKYFWEFGRWVDLYGNPAPADIVPELQRQKSVDDYEENKTSLIRTFSVEELIEKAVEFRKKINSYHHRNSQFLGDLIDCRDEYAAEALKLYAAAMCKAYDELDSCGVSEVRRKCSSGIASCYRNLERPELVVRMFDNWDAQDLSAAFYVSLSAAYLDLHDLSSSEYYFQFAYQRYGYLTEHLARLSCRIEAYKESAY